MSAREPVAIIGAGSIGWAWAIVFAAVGHTVAIGDVDGKQLDAAAGAVADRLAALAAHGLLKDPPQAVMARLRFSGDLESVVRGAAYIQECIPERVSDKQQLFAWLAPLAGRHAIVASSSSFLPASATASHVEGRERFLVVHPGNPPYLLKVAEVVPAPFTAPEIVEGAERLLAGAGIEPIRLRREIDGFVFNRLQGAVLREAYALVRDGIARAGDIDHLMRDGLGLRWSVAGPFETVDLNTRGGLAAHAERMLPAYERMAAERGERELPWPADVIESVVAERRAALSLDKWHERAAWRDQELMALLAHRARHDAGKEREPDE